MWPYKYDLHHKQQKNSHCFCPVLFTKTKHLSEVLEDLRNVVVSKKVEGSSSSLVCPIIHELVCCVNHYYLQYILLL